MKGYKLKKMYIKMIKKIGVYITLQNFISNQFYQTSKNCKASTNL